MKRNSERQWYNEGYSDGVNATKRDGIVPRVIAVSCVCALLYFDFYWVIAFVTIWAVFSLEEWHDLRKYHEPSVPPEKWE